MAYINLEEAVLHKRFSCANGKYQCNRCPGNILYDVSINKKLFEFVFGNIDPSLPPDRLCFLGACYTSHPAENPLLKPVFEGSW